MTPGATRNQAVIAGGLVLVTMVAYSPALAAPAFSARAGAILVSSAIAAWWLMVTRPRLQAVDLAALALSSWCLISAAFAQSTIAWTGTYPRGTGALMWCGAGILFVATRRLEVHARRLMVVAVVVAAILSALVALVQLGLDTGVWSFVLVDSRAHGLMGNPVFLGALCAAAVPLATSVCVDSHKSMLLTAGCAAGVQASGSRIALAAAVVAGIAASATSATTKQRAARSAALTGVAVIAGIALASGVASIGRNPTTAATERIVSSEAAASGLDQRVGVWRAGLDATLERPIAGWGPGRFRAATAPERSLDDVRSVAPGTVFDDAHNLFVQQATTTGIVGLVILIVWLAMAARNVQWRSATAAAAMSLGSTHLLQPEHVALTPLLLVLVALACNTTEGNAAGTRTIKRSALSHACGAALTTAAVSIASLLVVGDAAARSAVLDFVPADAARASNLLRPWAPPKLLEARVHLFHDRTGVQGAGERGLALAYEAARREPDLPPTHTLVALLAARLGRLDEALAATGRALGADPWSADALGARAEILRGLGRGSVATDCDLARRAAQPGSDVTVADGERSHDRCRSGV